MKTSEDAERSHKDQSASPTGIRCKNWKASPALALVTKGDTLVAGSTGSFWIFFGLLFSSAPRLNISVVVFFGVLIIIFPFLALIRWSLLLFCYCFILCYLVMVKASVEKKKKILKG